MATPSSIRTLSADAGYWGDVPVPKLIADICGGCSQFQLIGGGKPGRVIRLITNISSVAGRGLTVEHWAGFSVGRHGTRQRIDPPIGPGDAIPPPAAGWLPLGGLGLVGALRARCPI